jgi:hypothetical protein
VRRTVGMVCGIALLVVACSGDDGASGTTAPGEATTTSSVTGTAEPGIVPVGVAPCDLVTGDEVAAATGLTVAQVKDEPPVSCVFELATEPLVAIFVTVDDGEGRFGAPSTVFDDYTARIAEDGAEAIPDLGDGAVYAPSFRGLAVAAGGGRFIAFGVNGGYTELAEPRDALVTLAHDALGRL